VQTAEVGFVHVELVSTKLLEEEERRINLNAFNYLYGWTVHFEIDWLFITNKCTWR
jgi:hypothetical protein